MDRIVASHLQSFIKENALEGDQEALQFEKFANFSVLSGKITSQFELDDVTTGTDDEGIDGIALVINEEQVLSQEDAALVFATPRRNNDVELSFIQAKRSEGFDLGEFLKFKEAIFRFISQRPYSPKDELLCDTGQAFDIVIDNVPKVRNGKPTLSATFVTTGTYANPAALETARNDMLAQINALGLFYKADIRFMGRDELIAAWVSGYSGVAASLTMNSLASLPPIKGIAESYLVVAKAKDYVTNLLTSDDSSIRSQLFEENVRHFLGAENPVRACPRSP